MGEIISQDVSNRLKRSLGHYTDLTSLTTQWMGKKWNALGDSITANFNISKGYTQYVNEKILFNMVRNYGISGTAITSASGDGGNSMSERYVNMDNDADLITVFGGTNDFGHNLPLGVNTDTTNTTFYGALKVLIEGLLVKYPDKTIAFFTPLHRTGSDSGVTNSGETNNGGFTLLQYVDAIKEMCKKYGVPVLDLYSISGIQPSISVNKNTFTIDGLHPNELGHYKLSTNVIRFFNDLANVSKEISQITNYALTLTGNENWSLFQTRTNTYWFYVPAVPLLSRAVNIGGSNTTLTIDHQYTYTGDTGDTEHFSVDSNLGIYPLKSVVDGYVGATTLDKFKNYLSANNAKISYPKFTL